MLEKLGNDLKVRDRRYVKVIGKEAELCALGSKFKVCTWGQKDQVSKIMPTYVLLIMDLLEKLHLIFIVAL